MNRLIMFALCLVVGCRKMQEQRDKMMSVCSEVTPELWSQGQSFCKNGINELYAGNTTVRPCLIGTIPGFCADEEGELKVYDLTRSRIFVPADRQEGTRATIVYIDDLVAE